MRSWSVIPRDQSSFDYAQVECLKNILDEILVCHTWGGQSSFDYGHVESFKKILGEILVCHTWGVSIIFWPCTCWIFKNNSRWDPGLSYLGGSIIFWSCTCCICKKILDEILVCHTWGGQSSFDYGHVESFKKILGEILVCCSWGVNHLLTMDMLNPQKKF